MKKRSTEILQRLLKSPRMELFAEKLTADYEITEKTLRKDIREILDFAGESQLTNAISFDNSTLRLTHRKYIPALMAAIFAMTPYSYKMSLEERKAYIIVTLLAQDGYYSMQQLADELYVTRNTIINDCKVAEEYLGGCGISFIARSKKGIRLEGSRRAIDYMLIDLFHTIFPNLAGERTFFAHFIARKMGFSFSLADIISYMNDFVRARSVLFANDVFFEIGVSVFVLLNNGIRPQPADAESILPLPPLDVIGHMIAHTAKALGCDAIPEAQLRYMESVIMQRGLAPHAARINDFELYGRICHFLLEISNEIGVDVLTDDLLIQSLVAHVKSMENWKESDFNFTQEYQSSDVFFQLRHIAEDKFAILEQYLPYAMTDKMKDSIALHICAAVLRSKKNRAPFRVLISCPGSMATGKYLEAQVRDYFNFRIVRTVPARELEKNAAQFQDVDFVISTVPLSCPLPVVTVSPMMTAEDIHKIQNMAFHQTQENGRREAFRDDLLDRIRHIYENGGAESAAYLDRALEDVLKNTLPPEMETRPTSHLLAMLDPKHIRIAASAPDWHQAMEGAADELLRAGFIEHSYLDEAIRNVEEYGSYIIVARGVALAHARKESGAHRDGIGLLVSRDGIAFDEGERVHLLFFFAQSSDTDYMPLFREIIRLGQEEENIATLTACTNVEQVRETIAETLSR